MSPRGDFAIGADGDNAIVVAASHVKNDPLQVAEVINTTLLHGIDWTKDSVHNFDLVLTAVQSAAGEDNGIFLGNLAGPYLDVSVVTGVIDVGAGKMQVQVFDLAGTQHNSVLLDAPRGHEHHFSVQLVGPNIIVYRDGIEVVNVATGDRSTMTGSDLGVSLQTQTDDAAYLERLNGTYSS